MDQANLLKSKLGEALRENELLKGHVKAGVGGVADYFVQAQTIDDLIKAVVVAHKHKIPYQIIGRGSSVVPSDSGFGGLVISNESNNIFFGSGSSEVIVDSGVVLNTMVNLAAGHDLGGLEFLVGQTGSVGGALYHNLRLDDFSIGDFVKTVTVLVKEEGDLVVASFPGKWMQFARYSSRIKKGQDNFKPVILTVGLQMTRRRKDEILHLIRDNWAKRKLLEPEVGTAVRGYFEDPPGAETYARYYLDQAGAKKLKIGEVSVSKNDSNTIINNRGASAANIRTLADELRDIVNRKFGFILEERIEYIGRW